MTKFLKVLYALSLSLFIICAAVVLTVCFKPLYYLDIDRYDMPARTGLSEAEIRENYDEMIAFLLRWTGDQLTLPTLPMSEGGKIHFADVKHVFTGVKVLGLAAAALTAICGVSLRNENRKKSLYGAGFVTLGIPAVLGLFVAVAWDRFFILFHKIFFDNDYWIFDPRTDPVITILPDGFFLHCMILIVALVAAGAGLCFLAGKRQGRKAAADRPAEG